MAVLGNVVCVLVAVSAAFFGIGTMFINLWENEGKEND